MKLLTKTTLFFLTIALFVLFAGGIIFYFSFRYMMHREVRNELFAEMNELIIHPPQSTIKRSDTVTYDLPVRYRIVPINKIQKPVYIFTDTLLYDNTQSSYQLFRMISYETLIGGKPVSISISKSLLPAEKLVEYVAFVTLALSLILLLIIIVTNNFFFTRIWGSFFSTIDVIKDYDITETSSIKFKESEITEFNQLNRVFEKMNERIKKDYQNLKEFIENVSHEIQNPLAIIKSRVDLLQQSENLDKTQTELIQSIQNSTSRMSNLNRSLILLSKIDNNQFQIREEVGILEIISLHLSNFEDIIQSKNISLQTDFRNQILIKADPSLISILLLNLLKNSIFHNVPSGTIEIICNSKTLVIRNTGKKLDLNPEDLFNRFTKSSNKPDSLGLGLSIVKKICDYYNFTVQYSAQENYHTVSITFR